MFFDSTGHMAITTLILIGSIIGGVLYAGHNIGVGLKYQEQTGKSTGEIVGYSLLGGISVFAFGYTYGMSAYGVYVSYCEANGYTPVTNVGGHAASIDPVKGALQQLNTTNIRPGQTTISRSRVIEIAQNYNTIKAQSSVYSSGGTKYLVDGHHTLVARTMLGKGSGPNMGFPTNQMPSATNIYWSKYWYEFWKTAIKIIE